MAGGAERVTDQVAERTNQEAEREKWFLSEEEGARMLPIEKEQPKAVETCLAVSGEGRMR